MILTTYPIPVGWPSKYRSRVFASGEATLSHGKLVGSHLSSPWQDQKSHRSTQVGRTTRVGRLFWLPLLKTWRSLAQAKNPPTKNPQTIGDPVWVAEFPSGGDPSKTKKVAFRLGSMIRVSGGKNKTSGWKTWHHPCWQQVQQNFDFGCEILSWWNGWKSVGYAHCLQGTRKTTSHIPQEHHGTNLQTTYTPKLLRFYYLIPEHLDFVFFSFQERFEVDPFRLLRLGFV